jgi:hypothetical protein
MKEQKYLYPSPSENVMVKIGKELMTLWLKDFFPRSCGEVTNE